MANKRINDLPSETDPASTDIIPIDGATTRQTSRANLLKENLEAIRALTSAADKGIQFTGAGTAATYDLTAAGKALLDDADATAQRTTLGLAIGTNVQAYDAQLSDIAGITYAQGDMLYHNGGGLVALPAGTSGQVLRTQGAGADPVWTTASGIGDMLAVTYDPASVAGNAFNGFPVANRTTLKALDTTKFTTVYLTESGREGQFVWTTGDFSTFVALDTQEGVFVEASSPAATVGVWFRIVADHLIPEWFGAVKDGVSDDSVHINAALVMAKSVGIPRVIGNGTYTTANPIVPQSGVILTGSGSSSRISSNGNIAIELSLANAPLIRGGIENFKIVQGNAANVNAVGLQLDACQRCTFENLDFFNYDAGVFALIQPTIVYDSGDAAIYGRDYHNFVFNEFRNIMVSRCNYGMVFRGGLTSGSVTNVITHNSYRNVVLREVTGQGIWSDFWHDNDRFYDVFINIVADGAVAVHLSAAHATNHVGVSAHHFYSLTIVRDVTVTWTSENGIILRNAPGCLFIGLASDGVWEVDGQFFQNLLNVEVYVLSSYMHLPAGDTTASTLTNRIANITHNTLTRQTGSVSVGAGVTSVVVTFPQTMYIAPVVGKGECRVMPYGNPQVPYWVDYTTITKTGFTIRFESAVPTAFPMEWTAEVYAVA